MQFASSSFCFLLPGSCCKFKSIHINVVNLYCIVLHLVLCIEYVPYRCIIAVHKNVRYYSYLLFVLHYTTRWNYILHIMTDGLAH